MTLAAARNERSAVSGLEDHGARCTNEPGRSSWVGPDSGAEGVEEGGGAGDVCEVELDDDVAVVVDRLADAMGDDSAVCSERFGAVERRLLIARATGATKWPTG